MDDTEDVFVPDFTPSPMVDEAVEKALAVFSQYRRGHLVLWATIETETGIGRESSHWPTFWHRVQRDFRRSTGIVVWARRGVGVKLLTVEEQLGWRSRKRMKKAARQHFKDALELQAIPDREMTERQRQERAMRVQQAQERRLAIIYRSKIDDILRKPHQNHMPRPPKPTPPAT